MKRRRAFTLIELITVTAIIGLITLATTSLLHTTTGVQQRVDQHARLQQETHAALTRIATALANCHRPRKENDAFLEGRNRWHGDLPGDEIRFRAINHARVRADQNESDQHEIAFSLHAATDDAPAILLQRTDPTRNPAPDRGGVIDPIAHHIVGLDVRYHNGIRWREQWSSDQDGWPVAIHVRVISQDPKQRDKIWSTSRIIHFPWHRAGKRDKTNPQENTNKRPSRS